MIKWYAKQCITAGMSPWYFIMDHFTSTCLTYNCAERGLKCSYNLEYYRFDAKYCLRIYWFWMGPTFVFASRLYSIEQRVRKSKKWWYQFSRQIILVLHCNYSNWKVHCQVLTVFIAIEITRPKFFSIIIEPWSLRISDFNTCFLSMAQRLGLWRR